MAEHASDSNEDAAVLTRNVFGLMFFKGRRNIFDLAKLLSICTILCFPTNIVQAEPIADSPIQRTTIPILGTTLNEQWEQVGIVADVEIEFTQRSDHDGLELEFKTTPGRFSSLAQRSVQEAIDLVAQTAKLNTDSWTVRFTLPYAGVTLYGESLSAMAALNVIAMAKGDNVHTDIVMTGTVTSEGVIGTVGGIPLKIVAAYEEHFRRVLIPEEQDIADGDWETPFLMHISPTKTIDMAYLALTDHPLSTRSVDHHLAASLAR